MQSKCKILSTEAGDLGHTCTLMHTVLCTARWFSDGWYFWLFVYCYLIRIKHLCRNIQQQQKSPHVFGSTLCVCFECMTGAAALTRLTENTKQTHESLLFRLLWALCAERKATPKLETTECTGIAMTHSLTCSVVPLRVDLMESEGDLTSSWWSLFTSLSSIRCGNTDITQSVNRSILCILRAAASP